MSSKTEIEILKTKLAKGVMFTLSRAACHRIVVHVAHLERELEECKAALVEKRKKDADSPPESAIIQD